MVEATESQLFARLKARSLNALQNNAPWEIELRQQKEIEATLLEAKTRLEEGVLLQLRLQRQRDLNKLVASKCYQRKDLSYEQAEKCEEYYINNDFKLNLLSRFTSDYLPKHLISLERCIKGDEFTSLPSLADKDRAFLACKENWRANLQATVIPELEAKAKELL